MRMYFDFPTWFRMLRLAWREQNPRNRRRLLFSLLVVVPLVASFHAVCFFLDRILFPGLRRTQVRTPVFIVGHARSGTTLLHRLMSRGRRALQRLPALRAAPSRRCSQKKLIRALARARPALARRRASSARVAAWEERKFGATAHIHSDEPHEPEEDDVVLTYSCASGYWIVRLPYMGELDFYHVDALPRAAAPAPDALLRGVRAPPALPERARRRSTSARTRSSRAGVESLIETFPDARIVVPLPQSRRDDPEPAEADADWRGALRKWSDARDAALAARARRAVVPHLSLSARGAGAASRRRRTRSSTTASWSPSPTRRDRARLRASSASRCRAGYERALAAEQQKRRRSTRRATATASRSSACAADEIRTRARRALRALPLGAGRAARWRGRRDAMASGRGRGAARGLGRADRAARARARRDRRPEAVCAAAVATAISPRATATCSASSTARSSARSAIRCRPHFRRAIEPIDKAHHRQRRRDLSVRADRRQPPLPRARPRGDTRHWRGEPPAASGRKAPQYVIFETPSGYAGDSRQHRGAASRAARANGGVLDSSKLEVERRRQLRDPARRPSGPEGHRGNFIATKTTRRVKQPDGSAGAPVHRRAGWCCASSSTTGSARTRSISRSCCSDAEGGARRPARPRARRRAAAAHGRDRRTTRCASGTSSTP